MHDSCAGTRREASGLLVSGSPAVLSSGRSAEPFSTGPKSGRIRRRSFSIPLSPSPASFFFCHSTTVAVSSQGIAMLTFRCGRRPSSGPSRYQLSHSCFLEGANVQFRRSANARKPIDLSMRYLYASIDHVGNAKWRLATDQRLPRGNYTLRIPTYANQSLLNAIRFNF